MKKISWIVALLVALSFTILFSSCGEDKLEFLPSQGIQLDVSGAVGVGGTVTGNTAKSFTFCGDGTSQYSATFAAFKVDLPQALNKYTKIAYTLVPLQGAVDYKAARVYGLVAQPTAAFDMWDQYNTTGTVFPITEGNGESTGAGTATINPEQALDLTRSTGLTGNELSLWLVITIRPEAGKGGKPTAYTVKNVRLLTK